MEKITWRIWESKGIGKALLIGGLVFYVPVINLVLLGYIGCWVRQLVKNEGLELPEWKNGKAIFEELVRVLAPFAVWVLLPVLLASLLVWALYNLLMLMHLGLFARTVAYLPLAVVAVFSPVAFTAALIRLYRSNAIREALVFQPVVEMTTKSIKPALFPVFQFYGLLAIGWPLIGFASFLAVLPFLAQLILLMRDQAHVFTSEA